MMLLDTCVLFWLEQAPEQISPAVTSQLSRRDVPVFASAISAFELGLKVHQGLIKLPLPSGSWVREVCRRRYISVLPINEEIAGASTELPIIHRDPCDRFLIATAQLNKLILATPDPKIREYPNLKTLW
ncbi:MAG TPA: type II toxin-antitoxin system VapC family toxin [Candidatus Paceibacterota bacterium]|nr:type II toxin-antitoxin system VapC family toxin [Verrucomicrobiota bacterium]HRY52118.1 type II toxin-antitoxin system VapC family toxin [Candidatus Paceibacterota bacterium]